MAEVRVIDLTELYRCLDSIKEPTPREKAAKDKVLEELLYLAEGLRSWEIKPRELAEAAHEARQRR